jgi:hypothetical protein
VYPGTGAIGASIIASCGASQNTLIAPSIISCSAAIISWIAFSSSFPLSLLFRSNASRYSLLLRPPICTISFFSGGFSFLSYSFRFSLFPLYRSPPCCFQISDILYVVIHSKIYIQRLLHTQSVRKPRGPTWSVSFRFPVCLLPLPYFCYGLSKVTPLRKNPIQCILRSSLSFLSARF